MSRTLVNPISSLFDAARRHHTVQVSAHAEVGIFDPHALACSSARAGTIAGSRCADGVTRPIGARKRTLATLELVTLDHTCQPLMPDIDAAAPAWRRRETFVDKLSS